MLDFLLLTPELIVAGSGLLLLVAGAFLKNTSIRYFAIAGFALMLATLYALGEQWGTTTTFFGGLLELNNFVVLAKIIIVLGTLLVMLLLHGATFSESWITFETVALILFSTVGMMLMVSANHLLSFYVALELMSLSLYILAANNRDNVLSAEAGVKYFVLGALASGFFLFGCSLVYGFSGTIDFTKLAALYSHGHVLSVGALLGVILILVALFFKMSAVPFHMWTPDVYQGAPTLVTAFFASAPKVAALAITARFLMEPLAGLVVQWQQITIAASVGSMVVGAIAALRQTNIKRLLAYSSIGHVGYLLLGISSGSLAGAQSVLIYLLVYIVMTAGMFGAVLQLKRAGKLVEALDDLKGLASRQPVMAAVISLFMLSMAGIPPFAGFFAKFYVFLAIMEKGFYWLAVVGVLSSVVAAFYYLKIIKLMYFDEVKEPLDAFEIPFGHKLVIGASAIVTLLLFLCPTPLIQIAREAARSITQ